MTRAQLIELIQALVGADETARRAAVSTFDALPQGYFEDHPPPRSRVEPYLAEFARVLREHPDGSVRAWCAALIGLTGVGAPEVLPSLIWHLENGNGVGVVETVWAIGELGPAAAAAAPALVRHLRNPDPEVRWRAAWALREIRSVTEDAPKRLAELFDDPYPAARGYAALAFIAFAPRTDWARGQLERLVDDPEVFPRLTARQALDTWYSDGLF